MKTARCWFATLVAVVVIAAASGCGDDDLVVGGNLPPTAPPEATVTPGGCSDAGETCTLNSQCCSEQCLFNECQ
jgi:hypothetical protein